MHNIIKVTDDEKSILLNFFQKANIPISIELKPETYINIKDAHKKLYVRGFLSEEKESLDFAMLPIGIEKENLKALILEEKDEGEGSYRKKIAPFYEEGMEIIIPIVYIEGLALPSIQGKVS